MPRIGGLSDVSVPKVAPPAFTPSPQQQAAFDFVKDGTGSAVLEAVAGAGKTTTLVEICKLLRGKAVFTAFNKKIADDIGRKLAAAGIDSQTVRSATFHSIGFAAWRKVAPRVKVDGQKLDTLMEELDIPTLYRGFAKKAVSLGKQTLIGTPELPADDPGVWSPLVDHFELDEMLMGDDDVTVPQERLQIGLAWAYKLLKLSNERCEQIIDFDDMIYAPLLHGAKFDRYDWVLVDEAQDTNAARRAMAGAMLASGGRLIAVGDRHQAIYGFTGADADALDLIAEEFECIPLPLTTTYRCPKQVVKVAQRYVSHIHAAETAPEGVYRTMNEVDFRRITPEPTDAILCRNTKPLVEMAFDLLRRRIGCHVEGRDIGQGLLSLINKWKTPRTVGELLDKLEEYKDRETAKYIQQNKEFKVAGLLDKVDTIKVLADHAGYDKPIYELEDLVNQIFRDTTGRERPTVTLSTVHKAKGREWDRVYLYGRNRFMPSPYAKQPWQLQQEKNLIYVAVTRAKAELIEVRIPQPGEVQVPSTLATTPIETPAPTPAPVKAPISPPPFVKAGLDELVDALVSMKGVTREEAVALLRKALD